MNNFDNTSPIYLQIVNKIKIDIISGKISYGDRLPSVRELALEMKVNPNTMQKALLELENMGLIYTERTNGKYATNDHTLIEKLKNEQAKNYTKDYIKNMKDLGYSPKEIQDFILKGDKL